MRSYHQLSLEERGLISHGLSEGLSLREIGRRLGRSHSTISREIGRHSAAETYQPATAHATANQRPLRGSKISRHRYLKRYVLKGLKRCWSPEQIAGRMRRDRKPYYACRETIYRYIYSNDNVYTQLPQRRPKRGGRVSRKRRYIPGHVSIHERSAPRSQFGHWEADLMLFRFNGVNTITTLVERKSRYAKLLLNHGNMHNHHGPHRCRHGKG